VHPECTPEVIALADQAASTSQMENIVVEDDASSFIIGTEIGMIHRLEMIVPDKKLYSVGGICTNMKKITLEKVYDTLKEEKNEVLLDPELIIKARKALDRMLEIV